MSEEKLTARQVADALLAHAKELNGDAIVVTAELSMLGGPPGLVCRINHTHNSAGHRCTLMLAVTDYYKSTTRKHHITEVLPLVEIFKEYDRLLDEACDMGLMDVVGAAR